MTTDTRDDLRREMKTELDCLRREMKQEMKTSLSALEARMTRQTLTWLIALATVASVLLVFFTILESCAPLG